MMNLREQARLRGTGPQAACHWSGEGGLPVPAVRVNARTVLIAPDTVAASAVPGGSAGRRGCRRRTERLTRAGRSKTPLLADRAPVTVAAERRDRLGRVNTGLAGAALAAHGRPAARNQTPNTMRRAAHDASLSTPGAA